MSVLKTNNDKELIVVCDCGCEDGFHIKVEKDYYDGSDSDMDTFCYCTYLNGNWYRDQGMTILDVIKLKLKKIWAIIRNKDFYYSDIRMTRKDFEVFREYINEISNNTKN